MDSLPLLSLLVLSLPVGAVLIWLVPRPEQARWVALITALVDLVISALVLGRFDASEPGFQLVEQASWIPSLNAQYLVGVDGISVLFLPLTVLLFIGVIAASWTSVRNMPRLWFSLLLLQESATLGVFLALDTVLFFLFWELALIPLYFLISLWGIGPNRRHAATQYSLVMLAGGIPLLFGFILLAFNHATVTGIEVPAGLAFDLPTLLATPLPPGLELTVFLLLLVGFAVKTPLFPLHSWLPVVAAEGPAGVTALLVGLKLGAYGLIRFAIPLAPEAARELHWLLAGLGTLGLLYGALAALSQTNLRRMLAYSSLAHVGLVVLGIASFSVQGLQGAVLQLLNFTVVAGGLFLLTGMLHHRTGSSDVTNLGGVARTLPLLAGFFLLFGLAGIGIPGTSGFPAELLILFSAFETHTGAGLAALFAMVLGAAYLLSSYRRAFLGPVTGVVVREALDLRPREVWLVAAFALVILGIGFFPSLILNLIAPSVEMWVGQSPTLK
ncbi:complex I subunit 4 family protein [Thiohalomonas denitrificans]|uniref:NADH-quinone oxidoreductase subunit M n=1 Tax=Thiohalomonas denitrificans TaxID=415747 RepID=A0A1G5QZF3_9GAMM|nr:NADH-quinone oxidoreductase subunit M [Thiohalomonas denitrificans]SCZ66978.1 NADH-quinone oxidoreductase subunit M [Thiohalomonas denitrificans]